MSDSEMPVVIQTPEFIAYVMKNAGQDLVEQAINQAMELAEMLLGDPPQGLTFKPSARQAGGKDLGISPVMIVCEVEPQEGFELPEGCSYDTVGAFLCELGLMLRDTGVKAEKLTCRPILKEGVIYVQPPE